MTKLETILAEKNLNLTDIKQIYSGKDHECRCGCRGKYYEPADERKFKTVLTRCTHLVENDMVREITWDEGDDPVYVNIATGESYQDHCYCLYFN